MATAEQIRERRAKWCAALRSGEYEQTTEALKTNYGHCCLGVGCEVFAQVNNKGTWREMDEIGIYKFIVDHHSEHGYMPLSVANYFGLGPCEQEALAQANDGRDEEEPACFFEIADMIEALPLPEEGSK